MKSQRLNPSIFIMKRGELPLSGPALVELLQAVLGKGARFRFRAGGFCMSPFIKDGEVVTVSPLPDALPGLGDVVAFIHTETGKLLVHRIVGKRNDSCIIKGDNTSEADDLVPKTNILGYVTRVERDGKRIFLGLGPERFLIAFLTRKGLLFPLLRVWRLVRSIIMRLTGE